MPAASARSAISLPTSAAAERSAPVLSPLFSPLSGLEAAASVTPRRSSITGEEMGRPGGRTRRRTRPPPLRTICVRPRRSRRAKRSLDTPMANLLLLPFLADDEFLLVLDALALVGLRLAEG